MKRNWKVELFLKSGKSAGFVGAKGTRCSTFTKKGAEKTRAEMQATYGKRYGSRYRVVYDPKGKKATAYRKKRKQLERSRR